MYEYHKRTFILQKYIERPQLYQNRKFDIRCYGMLTSVNGHLKGFFYDTD
jgi:tubulin---tyrosine ligase